MSPKLSRVHRNPNRQQQAHLDMVMLDELGYLPLSRAGGVLRCNLLCRECEHMSVAIATSSDFADWCFSRDLRRRKVHFIKDSPTNWIILGGRSLRGLPDV
ncbi:ATP-binding protein [Paraburkholderia heleia]|uniref:ATP-binding protein n=1 Tax=Paraburkholderia heleia TaxID=634127 RepID=UPI002AB68572|nr:ATP-binding protein [Paraburkholderia heleia]